MKNYNKNELKNITKKSFSIAEVCRNLNIRPVGGNYKTLKNYFRIFQIDTSHFTGQAWNSGDKYIHNGKKYSLDEILIENSTYTNNARLKIRLINENIKEYKCEECGLIKWNNKKISLHLDHINGDNLDNRITNLRFLCPNCHSQTETYCNQKMICKSSELRKNNYDNKKGKILKEQKVKIIKKEHQQYCECGKEISKTAKNCKSCSKKLQERKVKNRPKKEDLIIMVEQSSLEAVGREYGVSGNAVKKWLKN